MENMEQQNTFQFVLGEETRPKIEFLKDAIASIRIEDSIFFKQYSLAMSSIADLVAYNEKLKEQNKRNSHSVHNNIIIFNGDRGSGKTSCMLTIKELLCDNNLKEEYVFRLAINGNQKNLLNKTNFYPTEIIDPIFFDEKHSILELFIGILFKNFKSEEEKRRKSGKLAMEYDKRNNLLQSFSNAKKNLSLLNANINLSEDDNLEQLSDLAASMNFKDSLWELVKNYMVTMYPSENSQMVLCIDDIDLNMAEGYQMIDQIRKYLNIPGLVILLAIKIDQLANVIRIKYSKDYEPILKEKHENSEDKKKYEEIINQIVEKYITKLFPLNQRITMPTVEEILNRKLVLIPESEKDVETLSPLKNDILRLIYSRTRMLFYNRVRQINFIIPRNLRELLNFLHFLYNMKEAKDHNGAIPNITQFKTYFYGVWCTNNLEENDLVFMRKTQHLLTISNLNSFVINYLKKRFLILGDLESATNDKDSHIRELAYILNKENIMYNLSLGDVMACLDWLDKVCNKDEDLKLIFAIKTFYSMTLYENFRSKDEISDEEGETINRQTLTKNKTNYGDIINGAFFNSEYMNVAPYDKEDGTSRSRRVIDNKLLVYIKLILEKNELFNEKINKKIEDIEREINENVKKKIKDLSHDRLKHILEFFILTTSFVLNSREDIFSKYRRKNEVYYEKKLSNSRKFICFDILSIFYNLLDVNEAYSRFDLTFDKNKAFLYDRILETIDEKQLHYKLNIRNVELLDQISYKLQRNRPDSGADSVRLYKKMFETLSEYSIKTYDNEAKYIEYGFFKVISEFLEELSKEEKEIFESIYSDKNPDN